MNFPIHDLQTVMADEDWERTFDALSLSAREREIVRKMMDDRAESEIAAELQLSLSTVHTYIGRLYRKLQVSSRSAAIVRIFQMAVFLQKRPMASVLPAKQSTAARMSSI